MIALLLGGVNEMVGIGCGMATIMMSSTPFLLANTGGSTRLAALATPPPAHKAMITLAAPTDRRSGTSIAVSLLDMSFLPALVYVGSGPRPSRELWTAASDTGIANTNTGYCKYPYYG
jgi:hypothetical protein